MHCLDMSWQQWVRLSETLTAVVVDNTTHCKPSAHFRAFPLLQYMLELLETQASRDLIARQATPEEYIRFIQSFVGHYLAMTCQRMGHHDKLIALIHAHNDVWLARYAGCNHSMCIMRSREHIIMVAWNAARQLNAMLHQVSIMHEMRLHGPRHHKHHRECVVVVAVLMFNNRHGFTYVEAETARNDTDTLSFAKWVDTLNNDGK